jgi:hypothetical protein
MDETNLIRIVRFIDLTGIHDLSRKIGGWFAGASRHCQAGINIHRSGHRQRHRWCGNIFSNDAPQKDQPTNAGQRDQG